MAAPRSIPLLPSGGMCNTLPDSHAAFQPRPTAGGGLAPPQYMLRIADMDVASDGALTARPGVLLSRPLAAPQGLWSIAGRLLHQDGGTIYEGDTALIGGLSRRADLAAHATSIYGTDGTTHFELPAAGGAQTWGLPVPTITVAPATGALLPATYTIHATFCDVVGNEGGTSAAVEATLSTATGIQVSAAGARPGVVAVNLYVSEPGQPETSFLAQVPLGAMPFVVTSVGATTADPPVTEQMIGPPPGLQGMLSFQAFMVTWVGNVAYVSASHEPHLFHGRSIIQFPADIRAAEGLSTGAWFATASGVWWVPSADAPVHWVPFMASPNGAFYGSAQIDAAMLPGLKMAGTVALFAGPRGVFVGSGDGSLREMTGGIYHFANSGHPITANTRAVFAFAERAGPQQLIVALAG